MAHDKPGGSAAWETSSSPGLSQTKALAWALAELGRGTRTKAQSRRRLCWVLHRKLAKLRLKPTSWIGRGWPRT